MCLSTVYRGKQKREALAKLPESGYYWKCVYQKNGKYWPIFYDDKPLKAGVNIAKARNYSGIGYKPAFHLFLSKDRASTYYGLSTKQAVVIRCKAKKKDIVAIGEQRGLCIVTTRFWCPKPKAK